MYYVVKYFLWYILCRKDDTTGEPGLPVNSLEYKLHVDYNVLPSIRTVPVPGHLKQKLNF